jgi:phospholipase C
MVAMGRVGIVVAAAGTAVAALTVAGAGLPAAAAGPATTSGNATARADARVTHVIEIMLENHSFDSLFGHFAGADGIPPGTSLPSPGAYYTSQPDVHPVLAGPNEGGVQGAINNSTAAEQMAMDYQPGRGYLMDRYTLFPQDGRSAITGFGPRFDPDQQYLAGAYELADRNFQPVIAPTMPNVLTALTGTDHGWIYNNRQPGDTKPWNSIFDELTAHGRTWKIYYALPPSTLDGTLWHDLIPPGHEQDLTTGTQFFADLSAANLPDFSFVRPGVGYSGEPPEDIAEADAWVGQLVSAVAHSKYWASTAIFISYDESGGFWDHVAPEASTGYGARTPLIIVSPYGRHGVFHRRTTNVSVLSFLQALWGMPPLTALNARQDNLMAAFDFGQAPRSRPAVPVAPADTIGFHGSGGILTDISTTSPGRALTITLMAQTPGLVKDTTVNGQVALTVTPPSGTGTPAGFPAAVTMTGGTATLTTAFPAAGYYRIAATGPGGSAGWVTVDVSVTPGT